MRAQMDGHAAYKPHQSDTPPTEPTREQQQAMAQYNQMKRRQQQAAVQQQQQQQIPLAHNGQNNHGQRRNSKVPVRELPAAMPEYQHPIYPQLYCCVEPQKIDYKWDCIILDLDRTIIHGKRLSVKRWRKYVENGTIPSLAENQCSKWHRHIHRKGHQMHPFIRGRTMIYYRPFTWHLLAVLDYLKSHFGTKIIVCTKAGEHYAASVLAALISNFTSANPDLIDDVYNFHDLHDDPEEDGKPKKPFRLICNRHDLDPKKTLIVDDNATSWFGDDRLITNFWMPPCYGYQIHDIDNELQLLCKYLWDPIQQNHLKKKSEKRQSMTKRSSQTEQSHKRTKRYQEEHKLKVEHYQQHSGVSNGTNTSTSTSTSSPKQRGMSGQEITSRSPKSVSSNTLSPKQERYLNSPNSKSVSSQSRLSNNGNSPKNLNELQHYPSSESLQYGQSIPSTVTSSSYSVTSSDISGVDGVSAGHQSERGVSYNGHNSHNINHHISSHNKQNAVDKQRFSELLHQQQQLQQLQQQQQQGQQGVGNNDIMSADDEKMMQNKVTSIARISRGYKQRQYGSSHPHGHPNGGIMIMHDVEPSHSSSQSSSKRNSSSVVNYVNTKTSSSPKQKSPKTKKKGYTFFQSKSRGSKKLGNISK